MNETAYLRGYMAGYMSKEGAFEWKDIQEGLEKLIPKDKYETGQILATAGAGALGGGLLGGWKGALGGALLGGAGGGLAARHGYEIPGIKPAVDYLHKQLGKKSETPAVENTVKKTPGEAPVKQEKTPAKLNFKDVPTDVLKIYLREKATSRPEIEQAIRQELASRPVEVPGAVPIPKPKF